MKKITFNATLNHKAYSYEPMQIEVEKVILPFTVRGSNRWRDHPLEDAPEIIEFKHSTLVFLLQIKSTLKVKYFR